MKKHIYQIDLIRTICCISIIFYHFACHTASNLNILTDTVNSKIGEIIVTVFFIVSGFVLYHSNKEIKSLKSFYWKRFKSIFPSFWICWFIFYVINVIKVRTPFYAGNPLKLLLTLIGQDGYFQQRIVTYYTVGEWFLGALIIVYALYPLLLKLHNKNKNLTLLVLIVLTTVVHIFDIPVISPGFPGICECCLKFYIGILMYEQINIISNTVLIASIIYTVVYSLIRINILNNVLNIIYSICIFIILYRIAESVLKENKITSFIAGISYQIFLLQHMIINSILEFSNPTGTASAVLIMLICVIITILLAYIINRITKTLLNSKLFKRLDSLFLE